MTDHGLLSDLTAMILYLYNNIIVTDHGLLSDLTAMILYLYNSD